MAEKLKASKTERGAEWYRNFNLATGSIAVGSGVLLAPVSPELATGAFIWGALEFASAGVAEAVRRWRKNSKNAPALGKTALAST